MLRALNVEIVALRDEFPQDVADIALFQKLNGRKLAFISTDTSQRTRMQEARALKSAGVTSLFFAPFFQKMQFWSQATWLIKRWPDIDRFAQKMAGEISRIAKGDRFESVIKHVEHLDPVTRDDFVLTMRNTAERLLKYAEEIEAKTSQSPAA